jgi:hypothetical protein
MKNLGMRRLAAILFLLGAAFGLTAAEDERARGPAPR